MRKFLKNYLFDFFSYLALALISCVIVKLKKDYERTKGTSLPCLSVIQLS